MARRRRPKNSKVLVTYGNGDTEQFNFLGKSTTGKSLKVANSDGEISYISLSKLQMYELK